MRYLLIIVLVLVGSQSYSQSKLPALDRSPMDMSYYPTNYPILKIQNKNDEPLMARIIYSRPQKNGRVVFGELVEYGKVWRLGANEATEIELFKDAKVGGARLRKGRYTMYAIPYPTKWTIIFNKETDIWGAFRYDPKKDVLRVDVKTEKLNNPTEAFTMIFDKTDGGADLIMTWDDVMTRLPFIW